MKKIALFLAMLVLLPFSAHAQSVTIPQDDSISGALSLVDYIKTNRRIMAIAMPSSWTAANLSFQVSMDCVTYKNMYDAAGNEYIVTAGISRYIPLDPYAFGGVNCIKVRSGTSSSAVVQSLSRVIQFMLKDY